MPNSGPAVQRNSTLPAPILSATLTPPPYPQLAAPIRPMRGKRITQNERMMLKILFKQKPTAAEQRSYARFCLIIAL